MLHSKPAKVERSCPASMNAPPHHHDHTARNNVHHKEALRLALGSILAPKRPHTPMSRSSSGSATPALHHDLGWPQLAVGESTHAHIRPGCSSLPHTHSHSPSAHSTHVHPQTPPAGAHPPQATHPHHRHPLSTHPSHPSTFGRPDLTPSTSSPSAPQVSQSQASSTHPNSHPPSLPHSPPFTPSHGTPPHVLTSPGHSSIPSGVVTPAVMTESSPSTTHSPTLGPSSIPEEEPLQMLPPLVAAGSTSANGEVHDLAPPPAQAIHPRPRSHPLQTTASDLEATYMNGVYPDGRSRSEGTQAQRAGFIQTLQSKNRAWDALIHGSFS
ncbi:hypothetical protein M378DRAFT_179146 [Amanita muscaria Koide BX008]|uniref:Uncharacterized protein n=1 Tax=Amanita muscaria (strain Koide BX008) TaxID=946122 RepID=A0A0C2X4Q5_AMAMK|nr:hypothetical protein M378DRAFT_179146 [Amanita muscaria Koide BX008]